jgi:hypothetical protein
VCCAAPTLWVQGEEEEERTQGKHVPLGEGGTERDDKLGRQIITRARIALLLPAKHEYRHRTMVSAMKTVEKRIPSITLLKDDKL